MAILTATRALEIIAIAVGVTNGVILLVKPFIRLHSRIDRIDAIVDGLENRVDNLEIVSYRGDT